MQSYDVCECGAPLRLMNRPTPKPTGTEVLLKVTAAGICHSDLHFWEGIYDLGGGKTLKLTDRGMKLPLTMGHETAGQVVALGPKAKGVKIGAKRLVYPWIGCGKCLVCKRGEENLCTKPGFIGVFRPGGYADHIIVPHPRYLFDYGSLKPEQAAPLACSGVTAYSALKKFGATLKAEPTVIIGAGGVGLMGACPSESHEGQRRDRCRYRSGETRSSEKSRRDRDHRRQRARCGCADPGRGQERRLVGGRFRRLVRDREARHRQHHQGRHGGRGRIVRRRHHDLDARSFR